jgi:membrane-associated phospholipid phosphatase
MVAAVAFAGFVVLAASVWHGDGPLRVDRRLDAWLPHWLTSRDARQWVAYLSYPGRPFFVAAASFAVAALVWVRSGRLRTALFCAMAPPVVAVVAELVVKPLVGRHGDGGDSYHFPSAHVVGVSSVAMMAWLVVVSRWPSPAARAAGAAGLAVLVAGVGASRMALHVHYATDVVGGALYAVAATLALAAAVSLDRDPERRAKAV